MANLTVTEVMEQLRTLEPKAWGAVAAALAVALFMVKVLTRKSMRLPPGPTNYPIIGALFSLGPELHRVFQSMSEKYGPVIYFKLGVLPILVVSSAEVAEEVLKTRDAEFASRAHSKILYSASKYFGFEGQGMGFAGNTLLLQRLRRVANTELLTRSRAMSDNSLKIRNEELGAMVREINRISQKGEPVRLAGICHDMASNSVCRMIFGKRYHGNDLPATKELLEYKQMMSELTTAAGEMNISDLLPVLRSLDPQGVAKAFAKLHGKQRRVLGAIVDDHKTRRASVENHDFVDTLLALDGDERFTDEQVMALIGDLLLGATETAAITCEWTFVQLLRHPDVLSKVYAELDSAVGNTRAVNEADVAGMPYLQAVIREVFRMHPVASVTPPRMNEHAASTLGGYDIPKGTSVFVNLWAIARDPAHWPRPDEFIPERFLGSDMQPSARHFQYIPFGGGRRICPGKTLGLLTVNMMVATLLQAFDFKPPPGTKSSEVSDRDAYGMLMRPRDPLYVRATLKAPLELYK